MSFFGPKAVIDDGKAQVYDYKEDRAELESGGSISAPSYDASRVPVGVPLQPLANMWKNANVPPTPQDLEQQLRSQQMPPPHMWMPPHPSGNGGVPGGNPLASNPLAGNPMNPLANNPMANSHLMAGNPMMAPPPGAQFPPMNFPGAEFMPPMGMPPPGAFPGPPPPTIWGSNEATNSTAPNVNGVPPPGFPGFQNHGPWGFPMPPPMTPEQMQMFQQQQQQQQQQPQQHQSQQQQQQPQIPSQTPQQPQSPQPTPVQKAASEEASQENPKKVLKETNPGAVKSKGPQAGSQQGNRKTFSRDSQSPAADTPKKSTETRKASSAHSKDSSDQAEQSKKPYSLTPQSRVTPRSIAETRSDPSAHRVSPFDQGNPRRANRYPPRSDEYYAESEALRPNRRFRHLMTDHDKRYVMDKCVKTMANDDPFVDDYYFHVYTRIHGRESNQREAQKYRRVFLKGEGSTSDKLRQQVQRAVERAQEYRQKLKEEDRPIRKFSATASRPRQALPLFDGSNALNQRSSGANGKGAGDARGAELLSGSLSDNSGAPTSEVSADATLRSIEAAYDSILALEAHAQRRLAPTDPKAADWAAEGPPLQEQLWTRFQVQKPVDKNGKQPFIEMLTVPKGMKAFARSWPQFDPTKRLTILTRIVVNIADLTVKPAHFDLLGQAVVQPVVHLIGDSDMNTVLLMADLARTKAQELALSRVGQLLLTAIVSRAEMLSQDGASAEAKENAAQWGSAFGPLFDAIVPVIGKLDVRDDAIWHFFAALALGSDLERQSELVDLVRAQIFAQQKAAQQLGGEAGEKKIVSLNLFLNVLGLDATFDDIKELKA